MKHIIAALFLGASMLLAFAPATSASDFAVGADLSFLKQAEDNGAVFKDGTNAMPGLQIFRNHGYNWIRLRLFVEPVRGNLPNDLAYTIAEAQGAKKLGYKCLLDLHYANSWADPGKQPMPEAWQSLTHRQRINTVFTYTRDTIAAFQGAGVMPDMVQVGNEVTHGMMWPEGKLPDHWKEFTDYLRAGIKGVDAGSGTNPPPRIMIHIDRGGDWPGTKYFFDSLERYHIHYDVIGLSYYPWWHGSLMDLRENLAATALRYHKDIIVVETAYYWHTSSETAGIAMPFPETPEGQAEYLDALANTVMNTPDRHGIGLFWWEPAVAGRGGLGGRSFFDGQGNSLPVLDTFDKYTRPPRRSN